MDLSARIYIAGHRGLLGSAVLRRLQSEGFSKLVLRTSQELDLRNQSRTFEFFEKEKPDYVFVCAAKVGGIQANIDSPGQFLYDNLAIQNNVMEAARKTGVKKLLFAASTCIYPAQAPQPLKEEYLLQGPLEPTNEGYAIAKIAGVRLCQFYRKQYGCNFIAAAPTNLFGINDHYDLKTSHLLPALMVKIHAAKKNGQKQVTLWGSGRPRREFMLSDDCADALVFLMRHYNDSLHINVGTGMDASVADLAGTVREVLGAGVEFIFDTSKPDGMLRKQTDITRLEALGWKSKSPLKEGIRIAYADFLKRFESGEHENFAGAVGSKRN
ncbi:MAG TPA: GDP-L-fucose synthase [bacterium]|nr:GDP-L-fucose synthase [bacterium]